MIEIVPNWHPLFVHFTVALLSLSVIFFIIQRPLAETEIGDNFLVFARYSLGLGIFFTVITVIAGIDAFNTVDHDTPSHLAMKDHRLWALIAAGVFLFAWVWSLFSMKHADKASLLLIAILIIGAGLLVNAGHKGSLLVYYYGLGVESLPETDDHDHGAHDHDHSGSQGKDDSHDHHSNSADHNQDAEHDHNSGGAHQHGDIAGEGGKAAHEHGELQPMADDGHAHSHEASESVSLDEPEVLVDKDGIVRESLPEVDMPAQKEAE